MLEREIGEARREGSIEVAPPDYANATFALSSDPEQLILSFRMTSDGAGPSMRLYGDGRLELRRFDRRGGIVAGHDLRLPFEEMTRLVRLAVDHGFAEWDRDSLDFRGLGRVPSHPTAAVGELHLESYQRGEYVRDGLARTFMIGDVRRALEYSADVLQVQGLEAMQQALGDYFESAENGRKE